MKTNPYGEDLHPSICARREIPTVAELAELATAAAAEGADAPNVDVVVDTLHVFGVDRMNTDEILRYFGDYAPSYVLWLDDSSCNLVFGDAANARRALFSLGQPIRLPASQAAPADAAMAAEGADAERPSQPQVCLLACLSWVLGLGVSCRLPACLAREGAGGAGVRGAGGGLGGMVGMGGCGLAAAQDCSMAPCVGADPTLASRRRRRTRCGEEVPTMRRWGSSMRC